MRHLKRDGWNVAGRGGHHRLSDPYRPDQGFINERARRQGRLDANDFTALKTAFGNRCATCGTRDGEPDPRYGVDIEGSGGQPGNRATRIRAGRPMTPKISFPNASSATAPTGGISSSTPGAESGP